MKLQELLVFFKNNNLLSLGKNLQDLSSPYKDSKNHQVWRSIWEKIIKNKDLMLIIEQIKQNEPLLLDNFSDLNQDNCVNLKLLLNHKDKLVKKYIKTKENPTNYFSFKEFLNINENQRQLLTLLLDFPWLETFTKKLPEEIKNQLSLENILNFTENKKANLRLILKSESLQNFIEESKNSELINEILNLNLTYNQRAYILTSGDISPILGFEILNEKHYTKLLESEFVVVKDESQSSKKNHSTKAFLSNQPNKNRLYTSKIKQSENNQKTEEKRALKP